MENGRPQHPGDRQERDDDMHTRTSHMCGGHTSHNSVAPESRQSEIAMTGAPPAVAAYTHHTAAVPPGAYYHFASAAHTKGTGPTKESYRSLTSRVRICGVGEPMEG